MADSLNAIYGLRVDVVVLKQGIYEGRSGSFMTLEITQPLSRQVHFSRYELRLEHLKRSPSNSPLYFAAYGPDTVTSKYFPVRGLLSRRRAAYVKLECVDRELIVTTRSARPSFRGVPFSFRIGFVVVHSETIQITTWPSIDTKLRMLAFRRTKVYPMLVDLAVEEGARSFITCAAAHRRCHPSCADFGAQHMSSDMWKDNLMADWAVECDTAPMENVRLIL